MQHAITGRLMGLTHAGDLRPRCIMLCWNLFTWRRFALVPFHVTRQTAAYQQAPSPHTFAPKRFGAIHAFLPNDGAYNCAGEVKCAANDCVTNAVESCYYGQARRNPCHGSWGPV